MNEQENTKELHRKIVKGLELTYERLIKFKKMKKSPLIIQKGDKIIEIDPEDAKPSITIKYNS